MQIGTLEANFILEHCIAVVVVAVAVVIVVLV